MLGLIISIDKGEHQSLEQIQAFMEGNEGVDFKSGSRKEVYEWMQATLCWHSYASLRREDKGLVMRYASKVTGLSRAQSTRLVAQYVANWDSRGAGGRGKRFTVTYLPAPRKLLYRGILRIRRRWLPTAGGCCAATGNG